MKTLAENNLVRFISISKRKEGVFANFKVKGIRGGAVFSAQISVDLTAIEVDLTHSMEDIIEQSAKIALKEFQAAEFQFEGLAAV